MSKRGKERSAEIQFAILAECTHRSSAHHDPSRHKIRIHGLKMARTMQVGEKGHCEGCSNHKCGEVVITKAERFVGYSCKPIFIREK